MKDYYKQIIKDWDYFKHLRNRKSCYLVKTKYKGTSSLSFKDFDTTVTQYFHTWKKDYERKNDFNSTEDIVRQFIVAHRNHAYCKTDDEIGYTVRQDLMVHNLSEYDSVTSIIRDGIQFKLNTEGTTLIWNKLFNRIVSNKFIKETDVDFFIYIISSALFLRWILDNDANHNQPKKNDSESLNHISQLSVTEGAMYFFFNGISIDSQQTERRALQAKKVGCNSGNSLYNTFIKVKNDSYSRSSGTKRKDEYKKKRLQRVLKFTEKKEARKIIEKHIQDMAKIIKSQY